MAEYMAEVAEYPECDLEEIESDHGEGNAKFEKRMKKLSKKCEMEESSSGSSDSDDDEAGEIIFLHVYLGPEKGSRTLSANANESPGILAHRFCKEN